MNERVPPMNFFVVGLNHKIAPVDVREQFAVNSCHLVERARLLKRRENLDEIVLLSTCNRVEIYAGASCKMDPKSSILSSLCDNPRDLTDSTYIHEDFEA